MTFQSETGRLKSVLIKNVSSAFGSQQQIDQQWQKLNYSDRPDFSKAVDQYEAFMQIFIDRGVQLHELAQNQTTNLDSIYTRDASVVTNTGVIICNMGKPDRNNEPSAQRAFYESKGIKVLGQIEAPGKLEGGDCAWIDEHTFAVARGYRTNDEGIRQLEVLLEDVAKEVIVFHSPHFRGPSDVFHLMSVYSPVDKNLAVVYSPLMPVSFREELLKRGTQLIEVPEDEYDSLGCNVLAIAPRVCVVASGNPQTKSLLEKAGAEVIEFEGSDISLKGCGGPTCLTRPLVRE
ncbi:MAG: arginine deiminase family protein [Cyclobacteriaceae bacterium]